MTAVRLERAHLPAVAALERDCFFEPWSEKALELLLTDDAIGIVCLQEGCVTAYGGMLWAPDEGQITNIAVAPDCRRQGYGQAVLEALIAEARGRNCEQISLEVRESNTAAISLYGKYGFSIAGRRKRFYKAPVEDALVMVLTL
ncbi:MAG: ribosomal protein S18-alanine N-acetyltransferase [Clostridia bacterium]|nr:ribosomal protein S18-alanine N-acetyltransferase [Clostridia bacterium]